MSEQKYTPLQNKLDSAMARLHQLRSQEGDDGLWDKNRHEQRAKLSSGCSEPIITYYRAHFLSAL